MILSPEKNCYPGDYVTVEATKGNRYGFNSSIWDNCSTLFVNLQFQETPIVPEFGFFIGSLTVIFAVAVFFLVRKE
jgi:hypothetical protein